MMKVDWLAVGVLLVTVVRSSVGLANDQIAALPMGSKIILYICTPITSVAEWGPGFSEGAASEKGIKKPAATLISV